MKNKLLPFFLGLTLALVSFVAPHFALAADKGESGCQSECSTCAEVCEKTLAYCKKQGGKHTDADHLTKLEDCIQLCKTSADFMKRGSGMHSRVCGACSDACTRCAESCESLKDKAMKDCAAECRKCADTCKAMSKEKES